ncbi:MAG: hypothetical protein FJ125_06180 [Deltaproteobacteria bacterium]|nr:hypothetical protein [Deltaproteobacteria bacterium]
MRPCSVFTGQVQIWDLGDPAVQLGDGQRRAMGKDHPGRGEGEQAVHGQQHLHRFPSPAGMGLGLYGHVGDKVAVQLGLQPRRVPPGMGRAPRVDPLPAVALGEAGLEAVGVAARRVQQRLLGEQGLRALVDRRPHDAVQVLPPGRRGIDVGPSVHGDGDGCSRCYRA